MDIDQNNEALNLEAQVAVAQIERCDSNPPFYSALPPVNPPLSWHPILPHHAKSVSQSVSQSPTSFLLPIDSATKTHLGKHRSRNQ
jgi:hypothetical protein